jgi:flagellar biosynthesis protein
MPENSENRLIAAALGYDPEENNAPVVLAAGHGKIAEQILAAARESQVPIHNDPVLAQVLVKVNINEEIPEELYTIVAQVLAYIYRIRRRQN